MGILNIASGILLVVSPFLPWSDFSAITPRVFPADGFNVPAESLSLVQLARLANDVLASTGYALDSFLEAGLLPLVSLALIVIGGLAAFRNGAAGAGLALVGILGYMFWGDGYGIWTTVASEGSSSITRPTVLGLVFFASWFGILLGFVSGVRRHARAVAVQQPV